MSWLTAWIERRREAERERHLRVAAMVESSNSTMRAISDVALELRASADRLEDVLRDLNVTDLKEETDGGGDPEAIERARERLDRLIQALERERDFL